jgi:hypothetical protein
MIMFNQTACMASYTPVVVEVPPGAYDAIGDDVSS